MLLEHPLEQSLCWSVVYSSLNKPARVGWLFLEEMHSTLLSWERLTQTGDGECDLPQKNSLNASEIIVTQPLSQRCAQAFPTDDFCRNAEFETGLKNQAQEGRGKWKQKTGQHVLIGLCAIYNLSRATKMSRRTQDTVLPIHRLLSKKREAITTRSTQKDPEVCLLTPPAGKDSSVFLSPTTQTL